MIQYRNFLFSLSVLLLCFCGCSGASSGNIGLVEGVVTLDGTPVQGAYVRFFPETGRGSSGKTDKEGHYELRYTRSEDGAIIGNHKVTITTEVGGDNYGIEDASESQTVSVPKKYLDPKKTELTATVESGKNNINFDLTSK